MIMTTEQTAFLRECIARDRATGYLGSYTAGGVEDLLDTIDSLRAEVQRLTEEARLSPSPQPATGAVVASDSWAARFLSLTAEERLFVLRCGVNGSGKYAASPSTGSDGRGLWDAPERLGLLVCVGSFAWDAPGFLEGIASLAGSPQPSADVVVVPREEWVELVAALPLEDLTERELTNWLRDINLERPGSEFVARHFWACAQDWTKRKFSKLRALRSSTNHDAQDAGEGIR